MPSVLREELVKMTKQGAAHRRQVVEVLAKEAFDNAVLDMKGMAQEGYKFVSLNMRYTGIGRENCKYLLDVTKAVEEMLIDENKCGLKKAGRSNLSTGLIGITWGEDGGDS